MVKTANKGSAVLTLPSDTEILVRRDFDAPRHLVYKAWTTPELVKRWWHANRGTCTTADIDLRVGGKWRFVNVTSDGREIVFFGEYLRIDEPERIDWTFGFEGMPERLFVCTPSKLGAFADCPRRYRAERTSSTARVRCRPTWSRASSA